MYQLIHIHGHIQGPLRCMYARVIVQCQQMREILQLVATVDAQWEGMGDVGSARYEPALLPLCPTIRVLSYSN